MWFLSQRRRISIINIKLINDDRKRQWILRTWEYVGHSVQRYSSRDLLWSSWLDRPQHQSVPPRLEGLPYGEHRSFLHAGEYHHPIWNHYVPWHDCWKPRLDPAKQSALLARNLRLLLCYDDFFPCGARALLIWQFGGSWYYGGPSQQSGRLHENPEPHSKQFSCSDPHSKPYFSVCLRGSYQWALQKMYGR